MTCKLKACTQDGLLGPSAGLLFKGLVTISRHVFVKNCMSACLRFLFFQLSLCLGLKVFKSLWVGAIRFSLQGRCCFHVGEGFTLQL